MPLGHVNWQNPPASLPYGPYAKMKERMTQTAVGRTAAASRTGLARLRSQGLGNVPGVAADIAGRANQRMLSSLLPAHARVDVGYQREAAEYGKWKSKFDEAKRLMREEKKWANKLMWIKGLSTAAGIALTIAAPHIGIPALAGKTLMEG